MDEAELYDYLGTFTESQFIALRRKLRLDLRHFPPNAAPANMADLFITFVKQRHKGDLSALDEAAHAVARAQGADHGLQAELPAEKFGRHLGRMEAIEGRIASFGGLIDEHASIVGRRFVIDHVARFLRDYDRGLLVIEAEPGKGKTALMAHLVGEIYGQVTPPPVHFFYRRTAGITDPDVCVKSLYRALLEAHNLTEAEESPHQTDAESMFLKLTNLLDNKIASRLTPGRAQLIFIDALDESEPTASGRTAFQRIPENLPTGIYVIATTRPVTDRFSLARRSFLHWFDLDAPDYLQDNLNDGLEYARRELAKSPLSQSVIAEVARVAAGNFLVLTLLCRHIRTDLPPGKVSAFLHRLAADGARDKLGFIYEEFWQRITARLARSDLQVLCDVAGVLVAAYGLLTADIITSVLGLRAGDWDFALRHLHEYLTVLSSEEGDEVETFYRIYHESFADFLRAKTLVDRPRYRQGLGDYSLEWSRHQGYGRIYALRFGPRHLIEASQGDSVADLLTDLSFLEATNEAGLLSFLPKEFAAAQEILGSENRLYRILGLLSEAIRAHHSFIALNAITYPQALLQSVANYLWPIASGMQPQGGNVTDYPSVANARRPVLARWEEETRRRGRAWLRLQWLDRTITMDVALLWQVKMQQRPAESLAFSPSGKLIAGAASWPYSNRAEPPSPWSSGYDVCVWSTETGELIHHLVPDPESVPPNGPPRNIPRPTHPDIEQMFQEYLSKVDAARDADDMAGRSKDSEGADFTDWTIPPIDPSIAERSAVLRNIYDNWEAALEAGCARAR